MSAFFFQTKTAAAAAWISVGSNAPVQMACVVLGCDHNACSGVPLAAVPNTRAPLFKKVDRAPEVQMLCLAIGCTHQSCVTARQSVLFVPVKPRPAAGANVGGVIDLAGAVQMACVAANCDHASCSGAKRSSSPTTTDMSPPASPSRSPAAHSESETGARLVRRNAITARSPRLGLNAGRPGARHASGVTDETDGL